MEKRIAISGFIKWPAGADLPDLGSFVTVAEFEGQVVSVGDTLKELEDGTEIASKATVKLPDGAKVLKVDGQAPGGFETLGDQGGVE